MGTLCLPPVGTITLVLLVRLGGVVTQANADGPGGTR